MIGPIFDMGWDFKAQLCLYAPTWRINLTQSWSIYKFRHESNSNYLIHNRKSCVHHYPTAVADGVTYIVYDRNTEEEKYLKLSGYLHQFTRLGFYLLQPLDSNCTDNSITQNVWLLYFQTLFLPDMFLMPKIEHWKNGSWVQIPDTALFLESTFHRNIYILGTKLL